MATSLGDPVATWLVVPRSAVTNYELDPDYDIFEDIDDEVITVDELDGTLYWKYEATTPCTSCNHRVVDGDVFVSLYSTIHCRDCVEKHINDKDGLVFKGPPRAESWLTLY